ncbi:hypothetical protein [Vibrio phage Va2]|nr:hypothetical protein [Vibrio phage Va2]
MDVNKPNRLDLMRRQSAKVSTIILRQSISLQGVLVDVFREDKHTKVDRVYSSYSGVQERNVKKVGRTRVLGLPTGAYRASKSDVLSGYFQAEPSYALPEMGIKEDDILVEVGTQAKWIMAVPEVLGDSGNEVIKFYAVNVME